MKKYFMAISIFALMFLGYPEAAKAVGKYVVFFLEDIIVFVTGYHYVDTFRDFAVKAMDIIEQINLRYLGAVFVSEIGTALFLAIRYLYLLAITRYAQKHPFPVIFKKKRTRNPGIGLLTETNSLN